MYSSRHEKISGSSSGRSTRFAEPDAAKNWAWQSEASMGECASTSSWAAKRRWAGPTLMVTIADIVGLGVLNGEIDKSEGHVRSLGGEGGAL
jgi:hypothetical protein